MDLRINFQGTQIGEIYPRFYFHSGRDGIHENE